MLGGRSRVEPQPGLALPAGLRTLPLAAATRLALATTIVLVLFGSSSVHELVRIGSPLRWVALGSFTVLAIGWALAEAVSAWEIARVGGPGIALAAVGAVSTAWSIEPLHTLERVVAFAFVVVGAAAAGAATRGRIERAESLAATIVVTGTALCVAGVLVYALDPAEGAQAATDGTPFRFAGLGQNPNTVPMLAAVAAALAAWLSFARRGRSRALYAGAFVVLCAEIAASGSRGAAAALTAGAFALAIAMPAALRRRALLLACAAAVAAAVVGANQIIQDTTALPVGSAPASAGSGASPSLPRIVLPHFADELGGLRVGPRVLIGSDGRAQAVQEALDEGSQRPVVGWGFGTETRAFIDRVAQFDSLRSEDSYAGLYLELGAVGVALWLLVGVVSVRAVVRLRREDPRRRLAAAGAAAAVAVGFALGIGQSYVYAAGNVATLSFWLVAAILVAVAAAARPIRSRALPRLALVAGLLVVTVPIGVWESSHARSVQNAGMRNVWRQVGGTLAAPTLDGFRRDPPLACLLYAAGGSPGGYELCFDNGRLVQAIDRRDGSFHAWTVQPFGAWAATLRVSSAAVEAQLRRLGAYAPGIKLGDGYQARRVG